MASLDVRGFSQIVANIASAVQGNAATLLDYSVGSVLRAIAEAESGVALWLQGNILKVLLTTRAATSSGSDLDTWVADYGIVRLGANNATGFVQFSSFTATTVRYIPVGAQVRTADLSQTFSVTADTTNGAFDSVNQRYVMQSGTASIVVPVVALSSGPAANAGAGTVTVISSTVAGVDTVTNTVGFTGGSDPESDAQLRARFIAFIASLSKATVGAIGYAITSLQLGLQYTVQENVDLSGNVNLGLLTIVVDDGTGTPPSSVVQNAQTAVNAVRAAGIRAGVYGSSVYPVLIQMTIKVATGFLVANVTGQVQAAVLAYVNGLGLGNPLPYTRLSFIAYGVAGVQEVTFVTANAGVADIIPTPAQTIKCANVAVSGS